MYILYKDTATYYWNRNLWVCRRFANAFIIMYLGRLFRMRHYGKTGMQYIITFMFGVYNTHACSVEWDKVKESHMHMRLEISYSLETDIWESYNYYNNISSPTSCIYEHIYILCIWMIFSGHNDKIMIILTLNNIKIKILSVIFEIIYELV